ncbi:MAG: hypothetical protein ACR2G6_17650 [Gemmatimonadaceae bacterium]
MRRGGRQTDPRATARAKPGPSDQLAGALNCYRDSATEGVWRTRPGLNKLAALQLGTASARVGQAVFQATRLDGSEFSFLFVGGKMYEYLWPTVEYVDRTPSAGSTAPVGFTIHPTNRIYCVMFADYMIVSDGANRPWKYDPQTRIATYLTDVAFVLFGPPWVYYSKLFGIKALERNVLVWSEELAPDIGYENALYNNRWILGQTSQDPLEVGYGTNTQIYLFRNVTALGISGAVTEEFQTQGTADDYPTGIAKNAGASLIKDEGDLFFLDTLFRPTKIGPGDQFLPLWQSIWDTVKGFDTAAGALVSALSLPDNVPTWY